MAPATASRSAISARTNKGKSRRLRFLSPIGFAPFQESSVAYGVPYFWPVARLQCNYNRRFVCILKKNPGIKYRPIDFGKVTHPSHVPTANVVFGDVVASASYPVGDAGNRHVCVRNPQEKEVDSISFLPQPAK